MLPTLYLTISILLQLVTLFFTVRLVKVSGFRWIWLIFFLAVVFRSVRVVLFFVTVVSGGTTAFLTSLGEVFGFFISVLLLIVLIWLQGLFLFFNNKIGDLNKTKEKYKNLLYGSYDGIAIMQDKVLKLVNPRFCEMVGYEERELLGKEPMFLVAPAFKKIVEEKNASRLSGKIKAADQYEMAFLKKDGRAVPVEVSISLIDYEGKPATMAIARDIAGRKKKEIRGYEFNEELMKINQVLIGRELKMLELKKENDELKKQLSQKI